MGGPCIILQKYEGGSHKTSLRKNEFFQPTPPGTLWPVPDHSPLITILENFIKNLAVGHHWGVKGMMTIALITIWDTTPVLMICHFVNCWLHLENLKETTRPKAKKLDPNLGKSVAQHGTMNRVPVEIVTPQGWDASPSQGYPSQGNNTAMQRQT